MAELETLAAAAPSSKERYKALFKLRGKLTWRRFTKETGRIVGLILGIVLFSPLILVMAVGSWFGYTHADGPWPGRIFTLVLLGMWSVWLFFPIVVSSLNEGISVERLLIYPLSNREIVISTLLGTLFDYPMYFLLPLLIAAIVGLSAGAPILFIPFIVLVCAVALVLMVMSSQLVLTALGGILSSRRFRDVAIFLISSMGLLCGFGGQFFGRIAEGLSASVVNSGAPVSGADVFLTLRWLPPGALGFATSQVLGGDWLSGFVWLGYALLWAAALSYAWMRLIVRLATGDGFLIPSKPKEEKKKQRRESRDWSGFDGLVSAESRAIFSKELSSMWRVPQRRILVVQSFIMPFFFVFVFFTSGGAAEMPIGSLPQIAIPLILIGYGTFSLWLMGQNMVGWEHRGLPMLLLTPVNRARIFIGKSLAVLLVGGLPVVFLGFGLAYLQGEFSSLLWVIIGVEAAVITTAVNALVSAWKPMPVKLDFKGGNNMTSGGCLAAIVSIIVMPIATAVLVVPLIALSVYHLWVGLPTILFAGAFFLSIFYAGVAFWLGTKWAGELLLSREPEVIEAAKPLDAE